MVKGSSDVSRRTLVAAGSIAAIGLLTRSSSQTLCPQRPVGIKQVSVTQRLSVPAQPQKAAFSNVNPRLLESALEALKRHANRVKAHDRIALVDFGAPSSDPRMHFLDVTDGRSEKVLVAHGSGSDPHHTGFVERFSNAFGSNASSQGAFVTADYYVGKHGRSQRLVGLDPTNSNALDRAVVIHGAWYANEDMIRAHGKLGRSQGCFAVGETKLDDVFDFLGQGRMIYAARA